MSNSKMHLLQTMYDNFYGCDFLLCLFMAALQSYRVDKCLRPFPSMYIENSHKDIKKLRSICESLPSLKNILKNPQMCSDELINLLSWLLCQKDQPLLKKIDKNIEVVPSQIQKSFQPNYIFEVIYPQRLEDIWLKRKGSQNTFLSYHGSRPDNFYSILRVGLLQHFGIAKELLYGEGIYLTTELTVSITYAPFGYSWKNSILGNKHSIVAVCEVIDNIDKVKCKDEKYKNRADNQQSISGSIPEKYFVVTDSDMVRLKYLLVYKENTLSPVESWFRRNWAIILICVYCVILMCIGFFQGPSWSRLKGKIYKLF